jgi:hypothetical protein
MSAVALLFSSPLRAPLSMAREAIRSLLNVEMNGQRLKYLQSFVGEDSTTSSAFAIEQTCRKLRPQRIPSFSDKGRRHRRSVRPSRLQVWD